MRNLRAWLQDRSEEAAMDRYGSWPLANNRMANAPKLREYDFHFTFGEGNVAGLRPCQDLADMRDGTV
jgi:hypothetical protein